MVTATGVVNMCSFYSAHVLPVPPTISSTCIYLPLVCKGYLAKLRFPLIENYFECV
jgi:hypothetical protein